MKLFALPRARAAGLTLIELLLVVLILSATALLAVTSFDGAQDQVRFEDTRARLERARGAILGNLDPAGSHGIERSFVSDIGRLPRELRELLEPDGLALWRFDATTGLWAGWRGPYLPARWESGGRLAYRDGWGNRSRDELLDDRQHGWRLFEVDELGERLWMQSAGSDGEEGGAGYAAEYPRQVLDTALPPPLVEPPDHLLDLRGSWIELELVNPGPGAMTPGAVRLALVHPREGALEQPDWPGTDTQRDQSSWLSEKHDVPAIDAGASAQLVVRFLAPDPASAHPKPVAAGARGFVLVQDADGARVGPPQPARPVRLVPGSAPSDLRLVWRVAP